MFKRKRAVKHQYKITFVNASGLTDGTSVKLSWKRGAKSQNQGETPVKTVENGEVTWNHSVSILCTLFGTSSGGFEEKDLVLELQEIPPGQKKGKKVVLGKIVVNLSDLLSPSPGQVTTKYHTVKPSKKGGSPYSLEVSYQTNLLGESDAEAVSETDMGDELSAADGNEEATTEDPFSENTDAAESEKGDTEEPSTPVSPVSPSKSHSKKKSHHHSHEKSKTDAAVVPAISVSPAKEDEDLKKKLEEMTKERDELKQTVEIMKKKQSKKSDDQSKTKDEVEHLKKQNKEQKDTIDDLKKKLDESEKKAKKLEDEAAAAAVAAASGDTAAAAAVAALQTELSSVKAERDTLKSDLEKAKSESSDLKNKNEDLKKDMRKQKKDSQSEQDALKKKLEESEKKVKKLEDEAAASAVTAASGDAAAAAAVASLQTELSNVKSERDLLKSDLNKAREETEKAKKESKKSSDDLKKTKKDLEAKHKAEVEELNARVAELEEELDEVDKEKSKPSIAAMLAAAPAAEKDTNSAELQELKEKLEVVKELLNGAVLKTFSSSGKPVLAERMLERLSDKQAQQNMFDESRYKAVTEALAIAVHTSFDGAETPLFWVATLECMLEDLGDANPCELAKSDDDKLIGKLKTLMYEAYVAAVTMCCNALDRVVVPCLLEASADGQKSAQVITVLAESLKQCKNARLPQAIRRAFIAQLVHVVDSLLVNALLSRQEFCCCKTGFTLRKSMTSLEAWLQRDPDTVGARKQLCHAREAANFFVMDKSILSDDSAVSAAFTALNVAQLSRLLEYFRSDDLNPENVDTSLVREMNRKAMDNPSAVLMLDPIALI